MKKNSIKKPKRDVCLKQIQELTNHLDSQNKSSYSPGRFFDNKILDDEKLLTKQEIADFLNVSIKMIDRKVMMNEIPYYKLGKLVRFSKLRVLAWAEENIQKD